MSKLYAKSNPVVNVVQTTKVENYETINEVVADDNYSTNEVTTNKKWIDGKTIYRKVINFGALPNNSSKGVNHNISNLERYVNYMAIAYVTATPTSARPLSYPADPSSANNTTTMQVILGGTQVIIGTGLDRTNQSAYIILEYTKTS